MPNPKKPTDLKILQGSYRPDRDHGNPPRLPVGIPELPEGWADEAPWGPEAVAEFHRMAPGLVELGLLTPLDRAAFLGYCDSWGRWVYYRKKVGEVGTTQTSESGYVQQRPEVSLLNSAAKDVRQFLALFGLSPSDRSKVIATGGGDADVNPFEEFRGGRNDE